MYYIIYNILLVLKSVSIMMITVKHNEVNASKGGESKLLTKGMLGRADSGQLKTAFLIHTFPDLRRPAVGPRDVRRLRSSQLLSRTQQRHDPDSAYKLYEIHTLHDSTLIVYTCSMNLQPFFKALCLLTFNPYILIYTLQGLYT